MSAVYSIFTSPHHPPVPDHLPTLIVTPNGRPNQILYTYLHTNVNTENYLLTPSEAGDLCVAKLFPPDRSGGLRSATSSASHGSSANGGGNHIRCEASRNLRWNISQTGIQNPIYKLTLPNPDSAQDDQPLFQVSKPNPTAAWWSVFYFAYAGHLIPPKRIEFGRIQKNPPETGGGTRVAITGKSDEEKAVWKTLGEGNEDMVEWIVICAALTVLDDEIISAAEKSGMGAKLRTPRMPAAQMAPPSPSRQRTIPSPQPRGSPMPMHPPRSATAPPPQGFPQPHPHQPPQPYPHGQPPHHHQQQQQQAYPPRQQSRPQAQQHSPSPQPNRPPAPTQQQQQQQYQQALPARSSSRQPSGYRPGPGPGPRPTMSHAPHEMPYPGEPQGVGAAVGHGGEGGAAARMVQQQMEMRRYEHQYQQQQQMGLAGRQ
ncbi:hypothetical protein JCM11641_000949 [Rhodosporidiobolus odoratus]